MKHIIEASQSRIQETAASSFVDYAEEVIDDLNDGIDALKSKIQLALILKSATGVTARNEHEWPVVTIKGAELKDIAKIQVMLERKFSAKFEVLPNVKAGVYANDIKFNNLKLNIFIIKNGQFTKVGFEY